MANRGIIPVDSKLPYLYSSLTETGILNQMLTAENSIFLGAFPAFQVFFIALGIFYFLFMILKRKELPIFNEKNARIIKKMWNLINLEIFKYFSKFGINNFLCIFAFVILSFIIGISFGIIFR